MEVRSLNINIGILGHVDSGKTSLSRALSTVESTASFDKNPQSKERGITLDLGFSSFYVDCPEHLQKHGYEQLQFTLVDCPGHASLIRTIIGGAQIIDLMLLVIDVEKGIQTQTAECLVIGEIACDKMIVVLNKIDLVAPDKQKSVIEKMSKRLLKTLDNTKFAGSPVVAVAANPGGAETMTSQDTGVSKLIDILKSFVFVPTRDTKGPFVFAADHCFSIRGQGTVMTGTVLHGSVAVNDTVEIPSLKVTKKVKTMQMFHKPVTQVCQGDRVGICVTQFDPKLLERGLVCGPGTLPTIHAAIVTAQHIQFFKPAICTKAKFHISVLHETVLAKITVFGDISTGSDTVNFDLTKDYIYEDDLPKNASNEDTEEDKPAVTAHYILLEFEHPIICQPNSLYIASRLDADIHSSTCRLAFHGRIIVPITDEHYSKTFLPQLKVYKCKSKHGVVERKADDNSVICKGMFKKETVMDAFEGLKVKLSTGEEGKIEGGFGQSGKFKVRVLNGLKPETAQVLTDKAKKKGKDKTEVEQRTDERAVVNVHLEFKRYVFDPAKKMIQK